MKISEQTLEDAKKLWKHIQNHQDENAGITARKFGFTKDQITKLMILWATGAKDSFYQAYESIAHTRVGE